jgi:hypothetical protein
MSDLARWKVHGPVESLRTEFATWDLNQDDWHPVARFTLTSYRSDGTLSTSDAHNPDESIAHSRWLYDDVGRVAEANFWMNDGPVDRMVYFYDEAGRHIRTMRLNHDGTQADLEVCSYDADGRKTKVQFLLSREADSECGAGNACGASTAYGIEGTDTAYGAPGATTMTVTYDEKNLPAKVLFHDANHGPLNCVIFRRDSAGRLLSEEMHQGEISPFQGIVDQAPPERREEMIAMLKQVLGETLSNTTYAYDAQGRLVKREHRMGSLAEDCTTYRYDAHDDPVEETVEHRSREASLGEIGKVHYSSDRVKTYSTTGLNIASMSTGTGRSRLCRSDLKQNPTFSAPNIERRAITYHGTRLNDHYF